MPIVSEKVVIDEPFAFVAVNQYPETVAVPEVPVPAETEIGLAFAMVKLVELAVKIFAPTRLNFVVAKPDVVTVWPATNVFATVYVTADVAVPPEDVPLVTPVLVIVNAVDVAVAIVLVDTLKLEFENPLRVTMSPTENVFAAV